jgi:hypothetical protein
MSSIARNELCRAIGESVTAWAAAEEAMAKLLAQLLQCRLEAAGIVWYSVISFPSKLELMTSLIEEIWAAHPIASYWPSHSEYARFLCARRNQIVHRELAIAQDAPFALDRAAANEAAKYKLYPAGWDKTVKAEKQLKIGPYDQEEIEFASREFWYLRHETMDLYLALGGLLPWPGKFDIPIVRLQKADGATPRTRP